MSETGPPKRRWLQRLRYDMELIKDDFGYEAGWYVEVEGDRIAILKHPKRVDMFWVSYEIESLDANAQEILCKSTRPVIFRNRRFSEESVDAFPAIIHEDGNLRDGRVHMRGLYLRHQTSFLASLLAPLFRRREKPKPQFSLTTLIFGIILTGALLPALIIYFRQPGYWSWPWVTDRIIALILAGWAIVMSCKLFERWISNRRKQ